MTSMGMNINFILVVGSAVRVDGTLLAHHLPQISLHHRSRDLTYRYHAVEPGAEVKFVEPEMSPMDMHILMMCRTAFIARHAMSLQHSWHLHHLS